MGFILTMESDNEHFFLARAEELISTTKSEGFITELNHFLMSDNGKSLKLKRISQLENLECFKSVTIRGFMMQNHKWVHITKKFIMPNVGNLEQFKDLKVTKDYGMLELEEAMEKYDEEKIAIAIETVCSRIMDEDQSNTHQVVPFLNATMKICKKIPINVKEILEKSSYYNEMKAESLGV